MMTLMTKRVTVAVAFTLACITTAHAGVKKNAVAAVDSTTSDAALETEAAQRQRCLGLGFDVEGLNCKRCDDLAAFLNNATTGNKAKQQRVVQLTKECRGCCTDLDKIDLASKQYTRAVLEVCTCKFGRYPKVASFVHNHADKHARLTVEYLNARHPHLLFYDANGEKQEEVSIASWNEETISEFLNAKLKDGKPEDDEVPAEETSEDNDEVIEDDVAAVGEEEDGAGQDDDADASETEADSDTDEQVVETAEEDNDADASTEEGNTVVEVEVDVEQ